MAPIRVDGSHFSQDVRAFIQLLDRHQVRYLVVGGEAVIFYGHARLTGDVDFFFAADAENAGRLFAALEEFWDRNIPGLRAAGELTADGIIVQFGVPPNRIDLINSIDGVTFDEAWRAREEARVAIGDREVPLHYLGLDTLIKNKERSGRPKDLDDLAFLRRAQARRLK